MRCIFYGDPNDTGIKDIMAALGPDGEYNKKYMSHNNFVLQMVGDAVFKNIMPPTSYFSYLKVAPPAIRVPYIIQPAYDYYPFHVGCLFEDTAWFSLKDADRDGITHPRDAMEELLDQSVEGQIDDVLTPPDDDDNKKEEEDDDDDKKMPAPKKRRVE